MRSRFGNCIDWRETYHSSMWTVDTINCPVFQSFRVHRMLPVSKCSGGPVHGDLLVVNFRSVDSHIAISSLTICSLVVICCSSASLALAIVLGRGFPPTWQNGDLTGRSAGSVNYLKSAHPSDEKQRSSGSIICKMYKFKKKKCEKCLTCHAGLVPWTPLPRAYSA